MKTILVFDIGTSSMRGIIYSYKGKVLLKKQICYSPTYFPNNYVEQDPYDWKKCLIEISNELSIKAGKRNLEICAISLTSQRSSLIPVDIDGNHLCNAMMWQDKRSLIICNELKEFEKDIYKKTGSKLSPIFTAPKIAWLKRNNKEIYNKSHKLLSIHDFILHALTGKFITDHSIASRSLIFNIHKLEWDDELLNLFDIEKSKLPELTEPGDICGYLTKEMSINTGFKEGIPIITAGGDQQCAAIGGNITSHGKLAVNTGTGSYVIACSDVPLADEKMKIICNVSGISGKFIIETSIPTTGTIYRWFNENFYKNRSDCKEIFKFINSEATKSDICANGIIMFPNFDGEGSLCCNENSKGMFYNINLVTKRCDFARAILEGIASEIHDSISVIEALMGKIDDIKVSGGLTKFDFFNQIQADMYEKKIICHQNEEVTSLGAWISAVKRLSIYDDYSKAYEAATKNCKLKIFDCDINNVNIYKDYKRKKGIIGFITDSIKL